MLLVTEIKNFLKLQMAKNATSRTKRQRGSRGKKTSRKMGSVPSSVKRYVKSIISRQQETKTAMPSIANNVEIQPYGVVNPHGSTHFSCAPLFTTITQGTGNGQRIGDTIKVQKLLLQGFINFDPSHYGDTNYLKNPLYIKMIVFRRKDSIVDPCNYSGTTQGIQDLLLNGSMPTFPQNLPSDMWRKFNTDVYKIYATRMFKIGNSANTTDPQTSGQWNNDFSLARKFSIDLSKHVDKIKFNESGGTPTNVSFNVAFLVCFANGYALNALSKGCAEIHYDINLTYKDA